MGMDRDMKRSGEEWLKEALAAAPPISEVTKEQIVGLLQAPPEVIDRPHGWVCDGCACAEGEAS
jgi:hypothetical protein